MSDQTFDLVWMQRLGGGSEVLRRNIPASDALAALEEAERTTPAAPGGVLFLRPSGDGDWQQRAETAEADAAALRRAIHAYRAVGMRLAAPGSEQWHAILAEAKDVEVALYRTADRTDVGAALLAELQALRQALEMAIDVRPELASDFQAGPLIRAAQAHGKGTADGL